MLQGGRRQRLAGLRLACKTTPLDHHTLAAARGLQIAVGCKVGSVLEKRALLVVWVRHYESINVAIDPATPAGQKQFTDAVFLD